MKSMQKWHVSVLLTLMAASRIASAQDSTEGLKGENHKRREDYFWSQRTYPSGDRASAAQALAAARATAASAPGGRSAQVLTGTILSGVWRSIGPTGFFGAQGGYFDSSPQIDAGRVTAIAPSPLAGGQLIIGSASGGVWSAPSLGAGWAALTDAQCSLNVGAVSVDPVNPSLVYAATGEWNDNSTGCGILRSSDGGLTWTTTGQAQFQNLAFGRVLIDPATAGSTFATILLAAGNNGLYRSTNSGTSWSYVNGTAYGASVIAHPTKTGVMFYGDADYYSPQNRSVYRSTDHGATWAPLPLPPTTTTATIGRTELAASAAAANKIFALIANATTGKLLGLFRWDDSLSTWTQLAASGVYTGDPRGDFGAQGSYDLAIAVDPRNAQHIYVAGIRGFVSNDGGATFSPMGMEIHCDWHVIAIDPRNPDMLYAGTDGGIFTSMDDGETWTSRNEGLAIAQFYPGISIHPQGTIILGGTQDNSSNAFGGAQIWSGAAGSGDGGYTAINLATPTTHWFAGHWSSLGPYVIRADASGTSLRVSGISASDRSSFLPPLVMDPVTPTKLYFATYRLYRTTNEGLLWSPISGDLSKGNGTIFSVAVAPSDTLTIYVGTSDGNVQVSRDGGLTFTVVSAALPNRVVTRIIVDPANAAHAYLTLQGVGSGHVFETANAGTSWTDISGNLPNIGVNGILIVAGNGVLMVATDVGIFQSANDGSYWQAGPSGLPNIIVQDIAYSPTSHLMVAATYGRGMLAYTVGGQAAVLRGDVNGDGKVDAFDALLIQEALVSSLPATTVVYPSGDANCNGIIEAADLLLVLRYAVGLSTSGACVGTVH